jgi:hypothetical protein
MNSLRVTSLICGRILSVTSSQQVYSYFGVDRASATGTPGSSISGQGTSSYGGNNSRESNSTNPEGNTSPSK